MRIVAGEFGGRPLKSLDSRVTRPTTDKIRGAIFNMIGPYFDGGRVLDLYAGTGALGIEAVSRGADFAVLVEKNRSAQDIIAANIAMTRSDAKFELVRQAAEVAVKHLSDEFDYVFLDPPYANEKMMRDIESLLELKLLSADATIICETNAETLLPDNIRSFYETERKTYGITKITIYRPFHGEL